MKISYDPEVDALSIKFREAQCITEHISAGIAFDRDEEGKLAGIEILDASLTLSGGLDTLKHVYVDGIAPAVEAG